MVLVKLSCVRNGHAIVPENYEDLGERVLLTNSSYKLITCVLSSLALSGTTIVSHMQQDSVIDTKQEHAKSADYMGCTCKASLENRS